MKKTLIILLAGIMVITMAVSVSALYAHTSSSFGSAYLNAYSTSGYAGTEANSLPKMIDVTFFSGGTVVDGTTHNNSTDYPYTWTTAEVYVSSSSTINDPMSLHSIKASNGMWAVQLPLDD